MNSLLATVGAGVASPVPKVSLYSLLVKMSLPVIMAFAEPCFPGLAVEKAVTLQGNVSFSIMREPGFALPASTRCVLLLSLPVSSSFCSSDSSDSRFL